MLRRGAGAPFAIPRNGSSLVTDSHPTDPGDSNTR
jgi:hypothetical protein